MIHNLIFWLIVAPAFLALLLGLIASAAQIAADKIKDQPEVETPQ
jgi:hypothetical protein